MLKKSRLIGMSALAFGAAFPIQAPALAQATSGQEQQTPASPIAPGEQPTGDTEAGTAAAADRNVNDIVVTGSRLATGFAMPTPVTILSGEDLQKTSASSLAESLRQIPSLSNSPLATNSASGSAIAQTNGQSLLNLRGLGSNRTLVLLDGYRIGVTNVVNSVDINIIPQGLIRRVDVVTGGASASYGSDAVSGVVNFILDTKFEGVKLEASSGITTRGDAGNWHVSAAVGKQFGDRARIIASADVFRLKGIPYGITGRDWFDFPVGQWPNPVAGATPSSLTLAGTRSSNAGYGGTITAVSGCPTGAAGANCRAFAGQQFLEGGSLAPFNKGQFAGQQFAVGGDGAIVTNGLTPDIERESLFAHAEFDVASNMTLWVQGIGARNYTWNEAQVPVSNLTTPFRIFEGNAFLPAQVAAAFAATPGTQSFTLSRYSLDMDRVTVRGLSKVLRGSAGIKGALGDSWSFDSAVAYQSTRQELDIYNTVQRNLYAASDAVRNPQTGQIVCYSQFFTPAGVFVPGGTGQDPGCVPLNLFGRNAVSQEASDYVMDWNTADIALKQTSADLNIRGNFGDRFKLTPDPISVAMGAGYRRLTADRQVDAQSDINIDFTGLRVCSPTSVPACTGNLTSYPARLQGRYGGYQYYNPSPLSGEVTVYEVYGELGIPLIQDRPFFQSLAATLAGRYTHYSQSGWEPMWKLGLNWTVSRDLRFRATYSADTRAPSVLELFDTATVSQGRNRVPCSTCAGGVISSGQNIALGNENLSPERARTLTAGVVLSPQFLPGFQVSLDYYKIKLRDAIVRIGPQNIVDQCAAGDQVFCSQIQVNGQPITSTANVGVNDFVVVFDRSLNFARETTSGLDFEAAYRREVGAGNLSLRFTGNYALEARVAGGCSSIRNVNLVGHIASCGNTNGAFPRVRARLAANYEAGGFGIYLQERYISGGKKDPALVEGVDISENDVPATFYTDLNLSYKLPKTFGGTSELFLQITNLLDQDPRPTLIRSRSWIEPSDLNLYDALGRRFLVGIRFAM